VSEDATKPVRELVKGFAYADRLTLSQSSRLLIDSLFFRVLPMARRVPGYRQNSIVS